MDAIVERKCEEDMRLDLARGDALDMGRLPWDLERLEKLIDLFQKLTCELFRADPRQLQPRDDDIQVSISNGLRRLNRIVDQVRTTFNQWLNAFGEI